MSGPAHGTLELRADGSFTYGPDANFFGEDSFTYRACDDGEPRACSGPETVTIDVAEVNDDPVADDDAGISETSQAATVAVLEGDADPDADELHVSDFGQPAHGTVDCTPAGVCTYTPEPGFVGTDSFEYEVSDGRGGSDRATVTLTVQADPLPSNQDPLAEDDTAETQAGQPVAIAVLGNDQDADGGQLSVDTVTQPQHGSVVLDSDGRLVYRPDEGFTGTDSFDYTVIDGQGGAAGARVTVTVHAQPAAENRPPAPDDDRTTTARGDAVTINVLTGDSDPDGDDLTLIGWTQPRHGRVTCEADGRCTYRPDPGFVGTDSFTYSVRDEHGATRTATVDVTVGASQAQAPDPEPPVDEGGSRRGDQSEGAPTVPAVDDGSPPEPSTEPVADESPDEDGGSLPHTGLALGGLALLGLAMLGVGVAGRRGLREPASRRPPRM